MKTPAVFLQQWFSSVPYLILNFKLLGAIRPKRNWVGAVFRSVNPTGSSSIGSCTLTLRVNNPHHYNGSARILWKWRLVLWRAAGGVSVCLIEKDGEWSRPLHHLVSQLVLQRAEQKTRSWSFPFYTLPSKAAALSSVVLQPLSCPQPVHTSCFTPDSHSVISRYSCTFSKLQSL